MKMTRFTKSILFFAGIATMGAAISCNKDDNTAADDGKFDGPGKYVIAVAPNTSGSEGVADYLLTADNLEEGTITTAGNGIEQDGTYRYYTTSGTKFFSMLYGQGNPGAVTIYNLDEKGKLNKLTNFQSETVQAFAPADKDILMIKNSRNYTSPISRWFRVSTESMSIVADGQFNSAELANNGELAHFSWIHQVGNKIFAPYFSIKATDVGGWTTDYPDSAWIAVYSYPDMQLEKVMRDGRTSSIGMYFLDGLVEIENGDVYAFSPSNTTGNQNGEDYFNSTKPSAITRIKAGTTDFDQSYYYDIEAASGGYYMSSSWLNVGNGNVIAILDKKENRSQWSASSRLAIINLPNKTFEWVNGLSPDEIADYGLSQDNYSAQNGIGYIGVLLKSGESYVYKVDASTATATKGLKVEGGMITSIKWLPAK